MRSDEIELITALAEQVQWLATQAESKVTAGWPQRQTGPDPQAIWSLQGRWNRRVEKIVASRRLSDRVHRILDAELGVLVGQVNDAVGEKATASVNQQVRSAVESVGAWRRGWNVRIQRIAITETTRIRSETAMASQPNMPGLWKRWISRDDERVRDSHAVAHGQTVPVQQPFQVGMGYLAYPGDPMGPPQETVNCRCELDIVTRGR